MDYLLNREINGLKSDIDNKQTALESEKEVFAMKIKNGLGEQIKHDIICPPKKTKETKKLIRARKWLILKENIGKLLMK